MGELTAERSARDGGPPRGPVGSTWWWLLAFGVLTTAGLAALTWALLVMDALVYGATAVISPHTGVAAPDGGRYRLAFVVAVVVNLVCAVALTWVASRTPARTWPSPAAAAAAAVVAAVVATCALLVVLGISPVDFVRSF